MESIGQILEQAAHHFLLVRPMLATYVHVLLSALFAIYTGSHASLTRPTSAAKPAKKEKKSVQDEDDERPESSQKMEGLSPSDAIMFPILAGSTLAGLYVVIKWLEDPAILNSILNWYFAVFGLLGIAKLFTDGMGFITSIVFPSKYTSDRQVWEVKQKQRKAIARSTPSNRRGSPLPGTLSKIKLPPRVVSGLWTLRELPSKKIQIRAYIYGMLDAKLQIGPQGCLSFLLALVATLYFNLVDKSWWLTNILGYSFAYASLQLMSPTTFSTGSLILVALFFYDIYFVFYTPLMVTVATKLDIPAKMLFPRPSSPKDDPAKQSLAMLGLGDIVLPGLVIGFALRFDLYLFYLRKQKRQTKANSKNETNGKSIEAGATETQANATSNIVKAEYRNATGGWSERFWADERDRAGNPVSGGAFPKTYFYACIFGYVVGMVTTLAVMSISGSAQPALLYLVPGVLISLWTTALVKGDLKAMWNYDETDTDDTPIKKTEEPKRPLKSFFSWSRQDEMAKRLEGHLKGDSEKKDSAAKEQTQAASEEEKAPTEDSSRKGNGFFRDRKTELIFFSVNLPGGSSREPDSQLAGDGKPKSKPSVEDELRAAFEGDLADTPPATRTRSMRKSILNSEGGTAEGRPEKRRRVLSSSKE